MQARRYEQNDSLENADRGARATPATRAWGVSADPRPAAASLQNGALDPPAPLSLHVAVSGATVVRLAGTDLAHQVEEHLRESLVSTRTPHNPHPTHTTPAPRPPHVASFIEWVYFTVTERSTAPPACRALLRTKPRQPSGAVR
ncbi:hypothetical protein KGM_205695 [Danaus plexippus plexippus]|uniref:Uncharacterized protein n=1 Tax=Danaus plexippus plexippus TaxID=278856 RepID=A0A212FEM1_DANPL|nr:hypothetical protein KGM_205695 [Danaus plexippus plexippus]